MATPTPAAPIMAPLRPPSRPPPLLSSRPTGAVGYPPVYPQYAQPGRRQLPGDAARGPGVHSGTALFGVSKPAPDNLRLAITIISSMLSVGALVLYIIYIYTIASSSVNTDDATIKQIWGVSADEWLGLALVAFVFAIALQTIFIGSRHHRT